MKSGISRNRKRTLSRKLVFRTAHLVNICQNPSTKDVPVKVTVGSQLHGANYISQIFEKLPEKNENEREYDNKSKNYNDKIQGPIKFYKTSRHLFRHLVPLTLLCTQLFFKIGPRFEIINLKLSQRKLREKEIS